MPDGTETGRYAEGAVSGTPKSMSREHNPSDTPECLFPKICDRTGQCENWLCHMEGCHAVHARTGLYRDGPQLRVRIDDIHELLVSGALSGSCSFRIQVSGETLTLHMPQKVLIDSDLHPPNL